MASFALMPAVHPPEGGRAVAGAARDEALPQIPPRRRGRLGDTVVEYLVDRIVAGRYQPHSMVPNEGELCDEFGVSRTVVRESIKLLEEKGLVRASSGLGTRVLDAPNWNLLDPVVLEADIRHDSSLKILDDLVRVRAALEADMAAQAAQDITGPELTELTQQAEHFKTVLYDSAKYLAADLAFHEQIMRASGNRLGQSIVGSIHAKAQLSIRYHGTPEPSDFEQSLAEHLQMLHHIASHSPDEAATTTRNHILNAWIRRRPSHTRDNGPLE
jgi:GntR family transcriptional regulator, galactonate operon transcriptional repressor